jgi:transcriptional regulator with XRE-family HTH domain
MIKPETLPELILQAEFCRLFGERVRLRREELGLTRRQLANEVGVHETAIGLVERGRNAVPAYRLFLLCRALGISASELIGA